MAFVNGATTLNRVGRTGTPLVSGRTGVRGGVFMRQSPYGGFFKMLADISKRPPSGSVSGRKTKMSVPEKHFVLGTPMDTDFAAEGFKTATFGLGCFWGAERKFWQAYGVYSTAVGYCGGMTQNPTYREVCSGMTGHAEVVRVIYDPKKIGFEDLLDVFWDAHDPTTLNQQGNDVGTQYRSVAYFNSPEEKEMIEASKAKFESVLVENGYGPIMTEISETPEFYFAEDYHQCYLAKNPLGYCGLGGTGLYPEVKKMAASM